MSAAVDPVWIGLDMASGPDRIVASCGCGACFEVRSGDPLLTAARMVLAVRPTNWDDAEDPDQVAAWSALEEALRGLGAGQS